MTLVQLLMGDFNLRPDEMALRPLGIQTVETARWTGASASDDRRLVAAVRIPRVLK